MSKITKAKTNRDSAVTSYKTWAFWGAGNDLVRIHLETFTSRHRSLLDQESCTNIEKKQLLTHDKFICLLCPNRVPDDPSDHGLSREESSNQTVVYHFREKRNHYACSPTQLHNTSWNSYDPGWQMQTPKTATGVFVNRSSLDVTGSAKTCPTVSYGLRKTMSSMSIIRQSIKCVFWARIRITRKQITEFYYVPYIWNLEYTNT